MTVHGAKGLEFEKVLLTGMEEEMFPYKGVDPGEHDELEEERRLAYVAITRARHELVMTHTQMRQIFGTTRWNRPSRFLGELPRGSLRARSDARHGGRARAQRYVDREVAARVGRAARGATRGGSRGLDTPRPLPEGRYVDHEFFDDRPDDVHEMRLRRGRAGEARPLRRGPGRSASSVWASPRSSRSSPAGARRRSSLASSSRRDRGHVRGCYSFGSLGSLSRRIRFTSGSISGCSAMRGR